MNFQGLAYRAHDPRWSFKPLSGDGAAVQGGRFNPKGSAALSFETIRPARRQKQAQGGDCKHACPEMLETVACSRPGGGHPPCPGLCRCVVDRRASLGIVALQRVAASPVLLVDLGGGSCELTISAKGHIRDTVSLPLGAVRWLVVCVVLYTAAAMLRSARSERNDETLAAALPPAPAAAPALEPTELA